MFRLYNLFPCNFFACSHVYNVVSDKLQYLDVCLPELLANYYQAMHAITYVH